MSLLSDYMALARLLQPSLVVIEDADLIARNRDLVSPCQEVFLKLIRLYGRAAPLTENVIRAAVKLTDNVSGAFIKELMRRAAQFHLERGGGDALMLHDIDSALEEMLFQGGSLNRKLLGSYRDGDEVR